MFQLFDVEEYQNIMSWN